MFETAQTTSFYLCQYNFEKQRWEWIRRFQTEQELIAYLASCFSRTWYYRDENSMKPSTHIKNRIEHRLNYNGKDIGTNPDNTKYFRDIAIIDSENHFINPRLFYDKALQKFHENENKKHSVWWHNTRGHYRYRKDPVPYTGIHYGGFGRNVKHWFRSYRQDRTPEHEPYVRKKAMVPNTWDSEPFHHFEKSWKHQTKCRHQWEKNLRKRSSANGNRSRENITQSSV